MFGQPEYSISGIVLHPGRGVDFKFPFLNDNSICRILTVGMVSSIRCALSGCQTTPSHVFVETHFASPSMSTPQFQLRKI